MILQIQNSSPEAILRRIDAIIQELEGLRQIILTAQTEPPRENLAQKLFGVLGQGKWEEYDFKLIR
ncbi:MAG: hypothetical protein HYR94_17770 [Chloroflexi bacterium]|nr:hypothetical protein [Chloroflexota bacterium]